jgi:hypothetical protein
MRATKKKPTGSYDELIKGYYGRAERDALPSRDLEELLAGYYGEGAAKKRKKAAPMSLSLSTDDGEVLAQPANGKSNGQKAAGPPAAPPFEEYVVERGDTSPPSTDYPKAMAARADEVSAFQEYQVDVLEPLGPGGPGSTMDDGRSSSSNERRVSRANSRPSPAIEASRAQASEDDIVADLQSILSGQKVYDQSTGRTVDRNQVARPQSTPPQTAPGNIVPAPDAANSQAIFDRIAQSMQYASTFDLGTVELENRFADFDRIDELQQKPAAGKKSGSRQAPTGTKSNGPLVGSADFLQDLEAIRGERAEVAAPEYAPVTAPPRPDSYRSIAVEHDRPYAASILVSADDYSRPFYDTGEHVLMGWDLYQDQLRVGKNPGVPFSYGQLIAMADLYGSVNEMMKAEVGQLQKIKALIERDTQYYKNKSGKVSSVKNREWNDVTNKRFMELAEDNYEHFSPNLYFTDAIAKAATKRGNNQTAWEFHHKWAIDEARQMSIDPANANRSYVPEWPLIINGFGDHFLTDAFAAGHVINKELTMDYFKDHFYKGDSLVPAAEDFFARVASLAWKGDVKSKFSVLETVDTRLLVWHPNIDTENAFRKLLVGIAEEEPDAIAQMAVKALHDRLNADGIEVFNDAGDSPWMLKGDQHLDEKSLKIIQKAVKQSVDNINDPTIQNSSPNYGAYFDKVWKYVPKLTVKGRSTLAKLTGDYTYPTSTVLSTAAAALITDQVDLLIEKLIDRKVLQHE